MGFAESEIERINQLNQAYKPIESSINQAYKTLKPQSEKGETDGERERARKRETVSEREIDRHTNNERASEGERDR